MSQQAADPKKITGVVSSKPTMRQYAEVAADFKTIPRFLSAEPGVRASLAPGATPDPAEDVGDTKFTADLDAGYKTVYVVGLSPKDKTPELIARQQNVQDYLSFITGVSNGKIAQKITSKALGSGDFAGQSDYRARLMNFLVLNTKGFLALDADVGFNHKFSCKTAELHTEILKTLFKGIAMPESLLGMFEGMFTSVKDTVIKISSSTQVDNKHMFLIVQSHVKNELGAVDTKLRFFLFKLSNKVREISVGKAGSYTSVDIEIEFENVQYTWNDSVYKKLAEAQQQKLVDDGKASMAKMDQLDLDV